MRLNMYKTVALLTAGLLLLIGGAALADGSVSAERAAWLLDRSEAGSVSTPGPGFEQVEIGGGGLSHEDDAGRSGDSSALPILASLVLPGAGEALTGHTRGYFMMALDIFAWTQVAKYHGDGGDLRDEYYAFADAHWSEDRLVPAYNSEQLANEYRNDYLENLGLEYFPNTDGNEATTPADLGNVMSLWVTREADEREYYENLGKWDQFVFGWDDFRSPYDGPLGFERTGTISDLRQSWTSPNRTTYRAMRNASNDAFKKRDRWLYVNIGLRVFSVLQVAYLQGLLGGGPDSQLEVAGHSIEIIAQPRGVYSGHVGASISF